MLDFSSVVVAVAGIVETAAIVVAAEAVGAIAVVEAATAWLVVSAALGSSSWPVVPVTVAAVPVASEKRCEPLWRWGRPRRLPRPQTLSPTRSSCCRGGCCL